MTGCPPRPRRMPGRGRAATTRTCQWAAAAAQASSAGAAAPRSSQQVGCLALLCIQAAWSAIVLKRDGGPTSCIRQGPAVTAQASALSKAASQSTSKCALQACTPPRQWQGSIVLKSPAAALPDALGKVISMEMTKYGDVPRAARLCRAPAERQQGGAQRVAAAIRP